MSSVSPRLATQARSGPIANIAKLRNVRHKQGLIVGKYAGPFDKKGRWDPLTAYYAGQKPHLKFAACGEDLKSICSFLEHYGSSGLEHDQKQSAEGIATVSVPQFRREVRYFRFVTNLAVNLKRPRELRDTFVGYATYAYEAFSEAH